MTGIVVGSVMDSGRPVFSAIGGVAVPSSSADTASTLETRNSTPTATSSLMATVRLLTWNIRYDSQPDSVSVSDSLASLPDPLTPPKFMSRTGEQPWSARRIPLVQHVLDVGPCIVALQEALIRQLVDTEELLGEDWSWVGVGRDDGQDKGEYSPLLWNKTLLDLKNVETFWLSDTPFKPSKYPGASCPRLATVATFCRRGNAMQVFTVINTHLDDRSEAQRRLGASLLLHRARHLAATLDHAVYIMGDFNSYQSGRESGAYEVLSGARSPEKLPSVFLERYPVAPDEQPDFKMIDLRVATPRFGVSGYFRTFTGFNKPMGEADFGRIDYILGGSNGGWSCTRYVTAGSVADDGMLISDHRPVHACVIQSE